MFNEQRGRIGSQQLASILEDGMNINFYEEMVKKKLKPMVLNWNVGKWGREYVNRGVLMEILIEYAWFIVPIGW